MADTSAPSKKTSGAEKAAAEQKHDTDLVVDSDPTAVNPRLADISTAGAGGDVVLVKADGSVSDDLFEDAGGPQFVTVGKDVVEEFYYPNTRRPAYRILFTKGQVVPRAQVEALQAAAEATKARQETGDVKLADYVDSSTYASGTGANAER